MVIKEDEANVIRQIYKWYNEEGFGFKKITHLLNKGVQEGKILPSRSGRAWQVTTIQRIIKNPTFCGTFILNQYTSIKVDGRKKQIRNPEEKWIVFEDHHPAFVKKEDWKLANSKKKVNMKTAIASDHYGSSWAHFFIILDHRADKPNDIARGINVTSTEDSFHAITS